MIEPRLVITVTGPEHEASEVHRIMNFPCTIGRAPQNDIILTDPSVSGHHAEIVETPEGLLLRDLGSRHGLLLEDVRRESIPLDTELEVRLGGSLLRLTPASLPIEATRDIVLPRATAPSRAAEPPPPAAPGQWKAVLAPVALCLAAALLEELTSPGLRNFPKALAISTSAILGLGLLGLLLSLPMKVVTGTYHVSSVIARLLWLSFLLTALGLLGPFLFSGLGDAGAQAARLGLTMALCAWVLHGLLRRTFPRLRPLPGAAASAGLTGALVALTLLPATLSEENLHYRLDGSQLSYYHLSSTPPQGDLGALERALEKAASKVESYRATKAKRLQITAAGASVAPPSPAPSAPPSAAPATPEAPAP